MDESESIIKLSKSDKLSLILKYAAGGAILGSLFYLVITGKIHTTVYLVYCTSVLTGLGVHGLLKKSQSDQS